MKTLVTKLTIVTVLTALMSSCGMLRDDFHRKHHSHRDWRSVEYAQSEDIAAPEENSTKAVRATHPKQEENSVDIQAQEVALLQAEKTIEVTPSTEPININPLATTNAASQDVSEESAERNTIREDKKVIDFQEVELAGNITSLKKTGANIDENNSVDNTLLLVIIAILIPFLAVGLYEGITTRFWISLLLTLLFYIPGMVYAILVVTGTI